VAVEIAHDARIRVTVHLDFGPVLHPDEVAADKTLALFGRAASRDLVDVDALTRRYTRQQLFGLAAEKDPGFDPRMFADALRATTRHADAAFAELGPRLGHGGPRVLTGLGRGTGSPTGQRGASVEPDGVTRPCARGSQRIHLDARSRKAELATFELSTGVNHPRPRTTSGAVAG